VDLRQKLGMCVEHDLSFKLCSCLDFCVSSNSQLDNVWMLLMFSFKFVLHLGIYFDTGLG